jgi:hypothetical protein
MEKVLIIGKMEEAMKDNTYMIKNMDLVCIPGRMEENTQGFGKMEKGKAKENIF